jgi:hypothetical protein
MDGQQWESYTGSGQGARTKAVASSLSDLETDFSSRTLPPDPAAHKNQDFLTLRCPHAATDPIQPCFEPRSALFTLFSPPPPGF